MFCGSRWLQQAVWTLEQYPNLILHTPLHSFGFPKENPFSTLQFPHTLSGHLAFSSDSSGIYSLPLVPATETNRS